MSPSQRSLPADWQATRARSVQPVPEVVLHVVYELAQSRVAAPSAGVNEATVPSQVTVAGVDPLQKQPASSQVMLSGRFDASRTPPQPFLSMMLRTLNFQ